MYNLRLQPIMQSLVATLVTHIAVADRTLCGLSWHGVWGYDNPVVRLYWLVDGEAWVYLHDRTIHLRPGRLYLIPAQTPATYTCPLSMDIYWLHFTARVLGGMDLIPLLGDSLEVPIADVQPVTTTWARLLEAHKLNTPAGTVEADGGLRQLLARFLVDTDDSAWHRRQADFLRFTPALHYIESHLLERITLADLAETMHLQATYFSNLFTRCLGESPTTYINRRRIACAQYLLCQSSEALPTIARAVGFSDAFYFSRVFKRLTGVSPSQFRQQSALPIP